jgi:hypothetical protein
MRSASKYSLGSKKLSDHNKSNLSVSPGPGEYKITLFGKNKPPIAKFGSSKRTSL